MRRVVEQLRPMVIDRRLQRFIQPDEFTLVVELYGWDEERDEAAKSWLLLSAHPQFGRVAMLSEPPKAPDWPPDFAAWGKKHMHRGWIRGLDILEDDRLAALRVETREHSYELLLSLMGPRSNLYTLDLDNGRVLQSLRPLEHTRADLKLGEPWTNPTRPPTPLKDKDRFDGVSDQELLASVERHYAEAETAHARDELRRHLSRALAKEIEFARRKESNLAKDLRNAKEARDKKHHGELLKSVMHTIKPGATNVTANDYETGQEIKIELDPTLSPAENLDRYFRRYHKGLVGANMLGQQLEITQSHIAEIEGLRAELEAADSLEALKEFAARPMVRELRRKHFPDQFRPSRPPKKKAVKKELPARMVPRRYRTSDDMEVWVGRSDEGNDYLTTQLADGNDWFFHVRGYPGSHTVLRTKGRKDPPQESVLEAAELCVHFSKLKDAKKVEVHVAPIKHVHKPKHAKPGLVYVNHGKSVPLRRDPARLERILKSRITDT